MVLPGNDMILSSWLWPACAPTSDSSWLASNPIKMWTVVIRLKSGWMGQSNDAREPCSEIELRRSIIRMQEIQLPLPCSYVNIQDMIVCVCWGVLNTLSCRGYISYTCINFLHSWLNGSWRRQPAGIILFLQRFNSTWVNIWSFFAALCQNCVPMVDYFLKVSMLSDFFLSVH